jgi:hypothetical protein
LFVLFLLLLSPCSRHLLEWVACMPHRTQQAVTEIIILCWVYCYSRTPTLSLSLSGSSTESLMGSSSMNLAWSWIVVGRNSIQRILSSEKSCWGLCS